MDILHTAVWVDELDDQLAFYESLFSITETRRFEGPDGALNVFIAGESDTELQFKYDEEASITVDPGTYDHVAVPVDSVDETIKAATSEWDSSVVSGPMNLDDLGVRIAFITDPAGYHVEIIESR